MCDRYRRQARMCGFQPPQPWFASQRERFRFQPGPLCRKATSVGAANISNQSAVSTGQKRRPRQVGRRARQHRFRAGAGKPIQAATHPPDHHQRAGPGFQMVSVAAISRSNRLISRIQNCG